MTTGGASKAGRKTTPPAAPTTRQRHRRPRPCKHCAALVRRRRRRACCSWLLRRKLNSEFATERDRCRDVERRHTAPACVARGVAGIHSSRGALRAGPVSHRGNAKIVGGLRGHGGYFWELTSDASTRAGAIFSANASKRGSP
jgi:hypothetical protein